jgi:putative phosphoesterase
MAGNTRQAETIGVISDTHGVLRPEALNALRGCDRILHAGDIGSPDVLEQLGRLAPVVAVRGNIDTGRWALPLPRTVTVEVDGHLIYVLHILSDLALESPPARVSAIVSGHSHKASIEERDGVLYLNPGSAGPRRFRLPVTVARMSVVDGRLSAQIIDIGVAPDS